MSYREYKTWRYFKGNKTFKTCPSYDPEQRLNQLKKSHKEGRSKKLEWTELKGIEWEVVESSYNKETNTIEVKKSFAKKIIDKIKGE